MLGGDEDGVLFKDWAWEEWKSKYGTSPPWMPKDFVILHKARNLMETEHVAREAWTAYLNDTTPFYEGHGPGLFLNNLSRFLVRVVKTIPRSETFKPLGTVARESFPGAARAARMVEILKEVEADATIPQTMKRDEMARRWKGIPQDQ